MPADELQRDRSMGGEAMRITVIGAILIVAGAVVVILILERLVEKDKRRPQVEHSPGGPAARAGSFGV